MATVPNLETLLRESGVDPTGPSARFITFALPKKERVNPTCINSDGVVVGHGIDSAQVAHGFIRDHNGGILTFDAPGAGTSGGQGTTATAINQSGQITGYFVRESGGQGFLREANGAFVIFFVPGARVTMAQDINESGAIVGCYSAHGGFSHGFLRERSGSLTSFDVPGSTNTWPEAINRHGEILGVYSPAPPNSSSRRAFLRETSGKFITFEVPKSSATFAEGPEALSDAGDVAGAYHLPTSRDREGFCRRKDGTITTFDVPNAIQTSPTAISSEGDITGYWYDDKTMHGFLREANGKLITFDVPASTSTWPTAINSSRKIIGSYTDSVGHQLGFIRE